MRKRALIVIAGFIGMGLVMIAYGVLFGIDVISLVPEGSYGTLGGLESGYINGSFAAYLTVPGIILLLLGVGLLYTARRHHG